VLTKTSKEKGEAPMKMHLTVTEMVKLINQIRHEPGNLFEMIRTNVQETVGQYLSQLMDVELTEFLGRGRYERGEGDSDHRNGSYPRKFTLKGVGEVGVKVPRDRNGEFKTQVLPRSKQYEDALREDISVMFLAGVSTRTLSLISERPIGRKISAGEVSKVSSQLTQAVERWRERDLSGEAIKYLFADGTLFSMRVGGSVEKVPVLVAIGVTVSGRRTVLGLQSGDKESASNWRELFKDLKRRGLDGSAVTLGIMDGLSGLERVFTEEFPNAKVQRCQIHVARNVLAKVPQKLKKTIADEVRSIFFSGEVS
jgi:putative transposase